MKTKAVVYSNFAVILKWKKDTYTFERFEDLWYWYAGNMLLKPGMKISPAFNNIELAYSDFISEMAKDVVLPEVQ